ncbi:cytochrome C oxidase subunit I [Pedobacter changchengzhani]|uniref:Cytochrome C oxidase subunit I n=1 Tax=Pedobacter changchengzhani TaxID=2529274 RepID=A0A4R5MHQ5_9SPHI|nr:cytochrome C oxidase subunit I [Pedobacter changchengzhani]TDG35021.1 cytochrome C oxidase subunit I [Pedobacter changchengzhani]
MFTAGTNSPIKNTDYRVVLPFYAYAALSFLVATLLISFNVDSFTQHHFNGKTLAITHTMALGWGTMMILGASHQLFPVLIKGKLHSIHLAHISFISSALGIPMLVYAFYNLNFGLMADFGAVFINFAVISYLINLTISIVKSKKTNVHAVSAFTAVIWLLVTTFVGLLLVCNFQTPIFSKSSVYYLSLHAHLGIIGWFLLMIVGVGARLIPMFLISKYENTKILWWIYGLINTGLITFIITFTLGANIVFSLMPIGFILATLILFSRYIYKAYRLRIRKKIDGQVKISMVSVALIGIPLVVITGIILIFSSLGHQQFVMLYGFTIFFGFITAIILGMTFKTLPFIVWNKVYHHIAGLGKTPNPKELFKSKIFVANVISYFLGFTILSFGIINTNTITLNIGAILLVINAVFYNINVFTILFHQPKLQ